jgi:hypothetical protein
MFVKHLIILTMAILSITSTTPFICELCDEEWKPVCSTRGITYYNKCHAICYMDLRFVEGECLKRCDCLDEARPVCGTNKKTYLNACMAACQGVQIDMTITGPCTCDCDESVNRVCGKNGITYLNACYAGCDGVGVRYQSRCTN